MLKRRISNIVEKSYLVGVNLHSKEAMSMQDEKDAQIKSQLVAEIESVQETYFTLRDYLFGKDYDALEMVGMLKIFKDKLDGISAHIITFYTLKGQRTNITWDQLLNNIGNALEALKGARSSNPRTAIHAALTMSQPSASEVMAYLESLKKSLQ
jgi:hypothetical protein